MIFETLFCNPFSVSFERELNAENILELFANSSVDKLGSNSFNSSLEFKNFNTFEIKDVTNGRMRSFIGEEEEEEKNRKNLIYGMNSDSLTHFSLYI